MQAAVPGHQGVQYVVGQDPAQWPPVVVHHQQRRAAGFDQLGGDQVQVGVRVQGDRGIVRVEQLAASPSDDVETTQELLYGLHALIRVHFDKEEEIQLPVFDRESPEAVANIPLYGTTDGVDAMLIGANDLAANMGHLGDTRHPDVVAKFDEAGRAIMATGKPAGFQFFDDRAQMLLDRGFLLGAVAGDLHTLTGGMTARLKHFGR